ncbi:MAG: hypothetical protein ABI091_26955 [Ferruginibacter sp.]
MNYFKNCQSLDEVKKLFRQLAKQFHPDKGGDLATMQAINNEYTKACILIAKGYKKSDGTRYTDQEAEAEILSAEAYKNAVNAIINIEGITIELCGSYIWVTPLDDAKFWDLWPAMKEAGYFFAKVKRQFYFRTAEYATKSNRNTLSKTEIRTKYVSQIINRSNSQMFLHA